MICKQCNGSGWVKVSLMVGNEGRLPCGCCHGLGFVKIDDTWGFQVGLIKERMKGLRMNQKEFGKLLGINQANMSRLLNGGASPKTIFRKILERDGWKI